MPELVLASASPRRQELLSQIGLQFRVMVSDFVEGKGFACSPAELAMHNALGKAKEVASRLTSGIVIGADTVVVCQHHVLEKPEDRADARRMLQVLSGRWHQVLTAVAIVNACDGQVTTDVVSTRVHMCALSEHDLESYIASGEPDDKAGAYGIQGLAAKFIDRIDGCYFNVVGLPLNKLTEMLKLVSTPMVN